MGPHGHEETTRRMRRSGKGLRPSGRIDSGKRREGAPLRGLRQAVRPHRRADPPEGTSDSRRRPPPLVRFDTVIGGRAALDRPDARLADARTDEREGRALVADARIDEREGRAPLEKGCVSLSGRLTNEREGRVSPLVAFWLARKLAYRRALKARQPER